MKSLKMKIVFNFLQMCYLSKVKHAWAENSQRFNVKL